MLRVEDTDAGRNLPESYQVLYDSLTWLGLTWDEGPGVGGPYAPYIQSERIEIYRDIVGRAAGGQARRTAATAPGRRSRPERRPGLPARRRATTASAGACRTQRIAELEAMSTPSVVRMRVPDAEIAFDDLVRGPVRFAAAHVPDFVIVRGNGEPLYTLVNPVDDSLMEITHVLRGEDLLPSTPRQIVLYQALERIGVGSGRTPTFGHLPTVLGEGNRRLSKRDKGSGLAEYQHQGYLPEALLNYLALLGWAIAEDRDIFPSRRWWAAFDIRRVNANPARFDARKCEAINAAHIRLLPTDELAERLVPFLVRAGLISDPPLPAQADRLQAATPLIQERINTLSEAVDLLAFLFTEDERLEIDPDGGSMAVRRRPWMPRAPRWLSCGSSTTPTIEAALRSALVEGLGLKPRLAFTPVRVAITGREISPPLFESIALLGRTSTLARIAAARSVLDA